MKGLIALAVLGVLWFGILAPKVEAQFRPCVWPNTCGNK